MCAASNTQADTGRGKNWCFTINNPTEDDYPMLMPMVKYVFWQLEKGAVQNTPHYQGYVQLDKDRAFSIVKQIPWLQRAHLERARKGVNANNNYCSKIKDRIDGPWELGTATYQGQRNDLEKICKALVDLKRGIDDIVLTNAESAIKYPSGCKYLRTAAIKTARGNGWVEPKILVYFGKSGCGKTRRAHQMDPDLFCVPVHEQGVTWFDGYDNQKTILWDDFKGGCPYTFFLRALDGYKFQAQTKGGFVTFNHELIIITSNTPPEGWYREDIQAPHFALLRRLYEFGNVLKYDENIQDYVEHPYTLPGGYFLPYN